MIDRAELEDMSHRLGVPVADVQRDYVFGWLLSGLFQTENPLAEPLVLKGGNAFRKGYFESARYSNDLDFSTQQAIDEELLRGSLVTACDFAGDRSGVDFLADHTRVENRRTVEEDRRLFEARIYFRSFYGEEHFTLRVNLDVTEFDQILLPTQQRSLIHSYSDAEHCQTTIRCMKLEELLASKLKALLLRQHSPDLFDFVSSVFFQNALSVNRLEVMRAFLRKTVYEPSPGLARRLLLELPFDALREMWRKYLVCPQDSFIDFEDAVSRFKGGISELFELVLPRTAPALLSGRAQAAYAGAAGGSVRANILEAGRQKRVLRIVYHGSQRSVEPYALAYKRRRDGVAREYFYAWDLTGGSSGQTGIKSFVTADVSNAQLADETFDPRFPIELAKGGVGYFSAPTFSSGSGVKQSRPKRLRSSGPTYKVQCPYCGKTFTRTKRDTKLNEHKDKYGNRCYGRVGHVVW